MKRERLRRMFFNSRLIDGGALIIEESQRAQRMRHFFHTSLGAASSRIGIAME